MGFDVLLTVHFSIFILVINQLDASSWLITKINFVGVLVICVLVFTVFCIVCTVFLYCFVCYIYSYLFCLH